MSNQKWRKSEIPDKATNTPKYKKENRKENGENKRNINSYRTERKGPLGEKYWEVTISKVINSIRAITVNTNRPCLLKKKGRGDLTDLAATKVNGVKERLIKPTAATILEANRLEKETMIKLGETAQM